MKPEQERIVAWMKAQLRRLRRKPERWAREAGLSPTTVTRAMGADYQAVTSVTSLVALARAAGVPTILDFLDSQASGVPRSPSPRVIRTLLGAVLPAAGAALSDRDLEAAAEATAYGLALLARNPAVAEDPTALRIAADAAASRLVPS